MSKELLFSVTKKDLKVSFFSGTGKGGQHRNRHMNCVRIYHPESGASSVGQSHKNKNQNLREALRNLVKNPKFRIWQKKKVDDILFSKQVEEKVNEMMKPHNLKVEVKTGNGWKCIEEGVCLN